MLEQRIAEVGGAGLGGIGCAEKHRRLAVRGSSTTTLDLLGLGLGLLGLLGLLRLGLLGLGLLGLRLLAATATLLDYLIGVSLR